ncbi:MAG TPA: hypothetical protein VMH00_11425 [Candidatus Limnocylindrales bacterium]|nr:hypothetical protein [Candidatus Limnocylindrales bacterium]
MQLKRWMMCAVLLAVPMLAAAQTQKPLTNDDIVNMTKQGFEVSLIIKDIQTSSTDFDVSPQALTNLKAAGVSQSVMEAMMSAHANQPSAAGEAAHGTIADTGSGAGELAKAGCSPSACLLKEGTELTLDFVNAVSSKTASDGDPVEFTLADDLKVGDTVVVPKDSHAKAVVTNVKRAGMMGKPGELNVQLEYLIDGDNRIRLRGTKGREGDSKTGAAVALTVIFGPIGLIKHGKNVVIPAGTPLTAYVDQNIWLPPLAK